MEKIVYQTYIKLGGWNYGPRKSLSLNAKVVQTLHATSLIPTCNSNKNNSSIYSLI